MFVNQKLVDSIDLKALFSDYKNLKWSVQGFGMIRTYLDEAKIYRLNVWHKKFKVNHVSEIHDHPWDFTSKVLFGSFFNTRFIEVRPETERGCKFNCSEIITGDGGGMVGEKREIFLLQQLSEVYRAGDVYSQKWNEIHKSDYSDYTVTINERFRIGSSENARVFWPLGEDWIDAKPRSATNEELEPIFSDILNLLKADK